MITCQQVECFINNRIIFLSCQLSYLQSVPNYQITPPYKIGAAYFSIGGMWFKMGLSLFCSPFHLTYVMTVLYQSWHAYNGYHVCLFCYTYYRSHWQLLFWYQYIAEHRSSVQYIGLVIWLSGYLVIRVVA